MRRAGWVVTGLSLGIVLLLGCQTPTGRSEAGPRTVEIVMTEFRFTPAEVQVRPGETVRFVLVNKGTVAHEFMIGTPEVQEEHEREMAAGTAERHVAEEHPGSKGMVVVEPGQTATLEYTAPEQPTTLLYGCHLPGHWVAGMRGVLRVGA
jgi:uncharacterized cupredoxin-like copper-binding protein